MGKFSAATYMGNLACKRLVLENNNIFSAKA